MGKKKTKKVTKEGETLNQQDGGKGTSAGGRRAKKEKEKDLIDLAVRDLMLNVGESDNVDLPRAERFRQVVLVEYLQENVQRMYPNIGRETYRVPDVHMNKGKDGEVIEEGVSGPIQPTDTDIRSDRAHSFVSDMVFRLSTQLKSTKVGPFFIISSYEYDHFLSRLKASFDEKLCPQDTNVRFPKGSGHDRGEIDILIVLPKHVIFMEIKAIGDNFCEYSGDKVVTIRENIKKATNQLNRDEKVFEHVMEDMKLQGFRFTKIAALPNLERVSLKEAMRDDELMQKCQGFKFLCKEDMPNSHLNFHHDFHVFYKWWIHNVFPEIENEEGSGLTRQGEGQGMKWSSRSQLQITDDKLDDDQRSPLEEVKVIVGRYVGFMSIVKVCNSSNSKLHRIGSSMEGRRKGQLVWYVGEKFANIVLTPDQKSYLDANIRLGYLCGPPGSGKTVVLSLRARRWILSDHNFVVIVNMYRGAPGRAIGKQIYRTITENSDKGKEDFLKDHTMEIGVDVSLNRFNAENFVNTIRSRWKDQIGVSGQRLMFLVDETYVQSYWSDVFDALRNNFADSAMWCAGLYGKQPEHFKSLVLNKVIRCPPSVQHVLSLIDWVEDRRKCYITDSTAASLPTNGPQVLTIRHQEHTEYVSEPPSQCPMCGRDLVHILQSLQVTVPGKCHTDPDLQLWSLQCSEIVILVNMPRKLYSPDAGGYLDTTVSAYRSYMTSLKECPLLKTLNKAGYPTKVHTDLACNDLVSTTVHDVVNVTWIYTYQGLENKVIIFIPGDEAMPEDCTESYLTEASLNIPCPGLLGSEDEECQDSRSNVGDVATKREESSRGNSECDSASGEEIERSTESDSSDNSDDTESGRRGRQTKDVSGEHSGQPCAHSWCSCDTDKDHQRNLDKLGRTTIDKQCEVPISEPQPKFLEEQIFHSTDINRYTRWDKSNLFISASRCTSQLILFTR